MDDLILKTIYGFILGMLIISGDLTGMLLFGILGAIIISWNTSLAKTKTNVPLKSASRTKTTSTSQRRSTGRRSRKPLDDGLII